MLLMKFIPACLVVLLGLSPLVWSEETLMEAKKPIVLHAELEPKSGSHVKGRVEFTEAKEGVKIEYVVDGLKPNQEHGFHIHEKGDCSAKDAKSAGSHYAMLERTGGTSTDTPGKHAGDLSPLKADANGHSEGKFMTMLVSVSKEIPIEGRAIVIHGGPDDVTKKSAPRIACGVIKR